MPATATRPRAKASGCAPSASGRPLRSKRTQVAVWRMRETAEPSCTTAYSRCLRGGQDDPRVGNSCPAGGKAEDEPPIVQRSGREELVEPGAPSPLVRGLIGVLRPCTA